MESASSSSTAQAIFSKLPIDTASQKQCYFKNKTINLSEEKFDLVLEQPVDFESLRANGYDVKSYFEEQGWMEFFDVINGPVYHIPVKDFWPKCDIITQNEADQEYNNKVAEDPGKNKGKSRKDLGLREFIEIEIRSSVSGYEVVITQSTFAELLKIPNDGIFKTFTPTSGRSSIFNTQIAKQCYVEGKLSNRTADLKPLQKVLVKIMFGSLFPKTGGTDQLSWDHRHFLYFLTALRKMNLAAYIFHQLCKNIKSAQHSSEQTPQVVYPRLMGGIFYRCGVIQRIIDAGEEAKDILEEQRASFITGTKFSTAYEEEAAPIQKHYAVYDNEPKEVILEYIRLMKEIGVKITGKDIGKASPVGKQKERKKVVKEEILEENTTSKVGASESKVASEEVRTSKVDSSEKDITKAVKEEIPKKSRSKKSKSKRKITPLVVYSPDSEETEEEQPQLKRKRLVLSNSEDLESEAMETEADTGNSNLIIDNVPILQAQNPPSSSTTNKPTEESMFTPLNIIHPPKLSDLPPITKNTDIDTLEESQRIAIEIHKNKSNEIKNLYHLYQDQANQNQQNSSLNILEHHLQGELPTQNSELATQINPEIKPIDSEAEKIQEVETSQTLDNPTSEQSPRTLTETEVVNDTQFRISPNPSITTIPVKHIYEKLIAQCSQKPSSSSPLAPHISNVCTPNPFKQIGKLLNDHAFQNVLNKLNALNSEIATSEHSPEPEHSDSEPSGSVILKAPPVTNQELAKICNKIIDRLKNLHQLRYSFTDPHLYYSVWESLRDDIDTDLTRFRMVIGMS
ncbi:hypothetical protein A2U01_0001310 [Trifolium medium]|uniref:Uncharacterized protein n=1 Tax=Trifolium medium TaxID=97028 RepID=A0A392LZU3_9FABA|nr:hypothetical protein [Trifolium medium]